MLNAPPAAKPTGRALDILTTAIRLFNTEGVAQTSTNKIADAVGISSGNLHYHFRGKTDVLIAVYRLIQAEMYQALSLNVPGMTPAAALNAQKRLFSTLWAYRFFFGSMDVFLTRSPALFQEYAAFQDWVIGRLTDLVEDMTERGHMRRASPLSDPRLFAANSWMLWTGWIHWEMIAQKNRQEEEPMPAILRRIIRQHFSFQLPYYAPDFAAELKQLIDAEAAAVEGR